MPRQLESVYVFIVENEQGDEGVASYHLSTRRRLADGSREVVREPMIAATEEKLEQLREIARDIVGVSRQRIKIVRFTQREHVANVLPIAVDTES